MVKKLKKWLLARSRSHASPEEVRETILAFVEGRGGAWDWDDFISVKLSAPELEDVRRRCANIEFQHPRRHPNEWTSDEGEDALRDIAAELAPNKVHEGLDVEHVLASTDEAVSLSSPDLIPLDPSWQRPGRHIELAGEIFAFPLWVDGGTIHDELARDIGISEQTIQRLTEFSQKWDEIFDARQNLVPLPTWVTIDELGHPLAQSVARELDETWTVHFLSLDDEQRWAWAGRSGEQVYP